MGEQGTAYRMTDLVESDRPRERLAQLGPQALTNAELIAILLRVGVKGENAVQALITPLNIPKPALWLNRIDGKLIRLQQTQLVEQG